MSEYKNDKDKNPKLRSDGSVGEWSNKMVMGGWKPPTADSFSLIEVPPPRAGEQCSCNDARASYRTDADVAAAVVDVSQPEEDMEEFTTKVLGIVISYHLNGAEVQQMECLPTSWALVRGNLN